MSWLSMPEISLSSNNAYNSMMIIILHVSLQSLVYEGSKKFWLSFGDLKAVICGNLRCLGKPFLFIYYRFSGHL